MPFDAITEKFREFLPEANRRLEAAGLQPLERRHVKASLLRRTGASIQAGETGICVGFEAVPNAEDDAIVENRAMPMPLVAMTKRNETVYLRYKEYVVFPNGARSARASRSTR